MFFIIILILIVAFLANQIRIVPQQTCFVIERLGKYYTEWEAGLHIKTPVIDKMVKKISLKEGWIKSNRPENALRLSGRLAEIYRRRKYVPYNEITAC